MITDHDGKPLYGEWERQNGYKEELDGLRVGDYVEFINAALTGFDSKRSIGQWNHRGWVWRLANDPHEGPYAVVAMDLAGVFQTLNVQVFTTKCYRKVNVLYALAEASVSPASPSANS